MAKNAAIMINLLYTKIRLPPVRANHMHRQRLLDQINQDPHKQLVLVSAPAGFGKSSCLIEWAHALRDEGCDVVWYALDSQDNDPARFATYLLHAFRLLGADFEGLPAAGDQVTVQEATNTIAALTQQHNRRVALILDDYHVITTSDIHDALSRLFRHIPPNMRLAIGTRADPPLHLARLRAQDEITEVRLSDLRFSDEELAQWLESTLDWLPSNAIISQLEKLTEGWAAALSLIMMAFKQHNAPHDEQFLARHLTRYSQTQRHIFDYFAQEVLEQQPAVIRHFLLDTCVLNQLHPELCQAVTGRPDAPLLLDQLAGDSLFILPLSDTEPVYRYHHLFEAFLRQHQVLHDQAHYRQQHRRAAQWHATHDSIVEAVHHALAAEDFDYAARLIETSAWKTLTARGELMTLVNWMPRFPEPILAEHVRLCLYFSRALYLTGHVQESETYVSLATDRLAQEMDTGDAQPLHAIACNCRATLAAYRGDTETGLFWIEQALARRDTVDALNRVHITNAAAFIRYLMGDVRPAHDAYEETLALAEQIDNHFLILDVQSYLAQLDLLAGKLEAVEARCERVLAQYPTPFGALSPLMLPLAAALHLRNRLVEAGAILRDALALAYTANMPSTLCFGHVALSNLQLSRGEIADAERSVAQAQRFAESYDSPMLDWLVGATAARVMLRSGRLRAAIAWADDYHQTEKAFWQRDYEDLTLVYVRLAQGDYVRSQAILSTLIENTTSTGRIRSVIEAEMLRALASQAADEHRAAEAALAESLALAASHGFVRMFLDAGPPMLALLRGAADSSADRNVSNYARTLLSVAQKANVMQHPADILTERQLEVLHHMAEGASNQDIADALVISVGTVKSHIFQIMSKLDAQNRTEAVGKARSLNILED